MASVSSRSVPSVSSVSVAVGWLARLRSRSLRLSRLALRRLARLRVAASAESTPNADMPRSLTVEHGEKYFAQI